MNVSTVQLSAIPAITIFVRHRENCPRAGDENYKACKCSKHLRWSANGKQHRRSAKTRTWAIAEERRREIEAKYAAADPAHPVEAVRLETQSSRTVERAVELFIRDKGSQGLHSDGLKKYNRELTRFREFMEKRSKFFPHEIALYDLTDYQFGLVAALPFVDHSLQGARTSERVLRYCYDSRLIDRVLKLSPIKEEPPTLPLTEKQYARMLKVIPEEFPHTKATRVHALIRLMRHSGLAIRDAVTLERAEFRWEAKPSFIVSLPIGRRPERMYRCRFPRRGDGDHRGYDAERKSQVRILEYGNGQATICRHHLVARSATSLPSGGDQEDREVLREVGQIETGPTRHADYLHVGETE